MKAIDRTFKVGDKVTIRKDIGDCNAYINRHMAQCAGEEYTIVDTWNGIADKKYILLNSPYMWRNIDLVPVDNDNV